MYCSYCGKQSDTATDCCKECNSKRKLDKQKGNGLSFWIMIALAPLLIGISNLYIQVSSAGFYAELPIGSQIISYIQIVPWSIIFAVIFVLCKKINPLVFNVEDAVVITVWRFSNYIVSFIIYLILAQAGPIFNMANAIIVIYNNYFLLSVVWDLVCFLTFLFVRSNAIKIKKKVYCIIGVGMIVFTVIAFILAPRLGIILSVDMSIHALCSTVFSASALCVGIRYTILFIFFICLATRKLDFFGGVIALGGAALIEGVVTFMSVHYDNMFSIYGFSRTVGSVFIGIVLAISVLGNRRSDISILS